LPRQSFFLTKFINMLAPSGYIDNRRLAQLECYSHVAIWVSQVELKVLKS
jgi:hypothetical protein